MLGRQLRRIESINHAQLFSQEASSLDFLAYDANAMVIYAMGAFVWALLPYQYKRFKVFKPYIFAIDFDKILQLSVIHSFYIKKGLYIYESAITGWIC